VHQRGKSGRVGVNRAKGRGPITPPDIGRSRPTHGRLTLRKATESNRCLDCFEAVAPGVSEEQASIRWWRVVEGNTNRFKRWPARRPAVSGSVVRAPTGSSRVGERSVDRDDGRVASEAMWPNDCFVTPTAAAGDAGGGCVRSIDAVRSLWTAVCTGLR